ncbi:MAG: Zn-dependent hydrolase [Chloroflexi bacterium]|nr:Zn-dependent hydrolase [Chloroflexota bacterium]
MQEAKRVAGNRTGEGEQAGLLPEDRGANGREQNASGRSETPAPSPGAGGASTPTDAASAERLPDPARLAADIQRLSQIGGDGRAEVDRLAFTPAEREAHTLYAEWLQNAGFSTRVDAFGNTIGERPGSRDLPFLALGSHLDSVPRGGRFDGVVGCVGALEVGRLLQDSGLTLRHPLRIVAFANEEGARFGEACLGSKAVAGMLDSQDAERLRDAEGTTLGAAMEAVGLDPRQIEQARWADGDVAAYLELHIEQGRLLEAQSLAIGIVDAVAGNTRLRVTVRGRADHSGGTPMDWRRDALTGAAEMVLTVESVANEPSRRATVATVGRLNVSPNNITTIPGAVAFSVDVRDVDSDRQRETARRLVELFEQICTRRDLDLSYEVVSDTSPSMLPLWLRRLTKQVCVDLGLPHRVMTSGAGHDAQILARRLPAGMLFVPSHEGLSHVPEEWTSVDHVARGVRTLYASLLRLDQFLADEVG